MSTTFTVTRDQIIKLALRKLGVIELGDTPDSATIQESSLALNLMIKQMSTEGLKLWKIDEVILPLSQDQTMYTLGGPKTDLMFAADGVTKVIDKPLKVIQGWYRNTIVTPMIDVPLQLMSKQEYNTLGSKFSTGVGNSVFYDPKRLAGSLFIYLTPDAFTEANLEVHLVCQMPLADIMYSQDIPDFPTEWMNCLVWNLADQLAIDYSVPANHRQEIAARAKAYRDQLSDWDVETSSTFFQPDYRMYVPNNRNSL